MKQSDIHIADTSSYPTSTFLSALNNAKEVALELLWPTRCAVCDLAGNKVLCEDCERRLQYIDASLACPKCGAPFGRIQCTECNDVMLASSGVQELPYKKMMHSVVLDEAARKIITVYKDSDERRLVKDIARIMTRSISPELKSNLYTITSIPDTTEAVRRRGFDHGAELAQAISKYSGLTYQEVFERPKNADQRKLDRKSRVKNMMSQMHIKDSSDLPDKVLLIDDVCTTGATIVSACQSLKDAGVSEIQVLTFAQV